MISTATAQGPVFSCFLFGLCASFLRRKSQRQPSSSSPCTPPPTPPGILETCGAFVTSTPSCAGATWSRGLEPARPDSMPICLTDFLDFLFTTSDLSLFRSSCVVCSSSSAACRTFLFPGDPSKRCYESTRLGFVLRCERPGFSRRRAGRRCTLPVSVARV